MKYRPEIDGLRALAVIPVVLYHAGFSAFGGGYVGVDVFFVISGYLITSIIVDELSQGRFSIWRFYGRRARRILPALFLVILVCLPLCWFSLMPRDLEKFAFSVVAVLTFTSNHFFWRNTGYFETGADLQPLLHTWSLGVEEQFYILFPLLLMRLGLSRMPLHLALLLIASLVFSAAAVKVDPDGAFFLLPSRAWELLAGSLAALYLRRNRHAVVSRRVGDVLAVLGLSSIAYASMAYDDSTRFPGISALPVTLGATLVILFTRDGSFVQRALSFRPLVGIGLISYGVYLWHQPVFALFQNRFGSIAFHCYVWPLIVLSFGLAIVGYFLVERPFRKSLSNQTLTISVLCAAILAVATATLIITQIDGRPQRVPAYRTALAVAPAQLLRYFERNDVRMVCSESDSAGTQRCVFGDPNGDSLVVLWGDSLAGALLSGIDEMARQAGLRGVAFIANACPPILGLANARSPECTSDSQRAILEQIEALSEPAHVVITGNLSGAMNAGNVTIDGGQTSYAAVREKLSEAVARLRARGARVIVLEQGPLFPQDVSRYLMQNLGRDSPQPLVVDRAVHVASLRMARELADVVDLYLETDGFFCSKDACPAVDADGELVIYDNNHVTREYSARLADFLQRSAGL